MMKMSVSQSAASAQRASPVAAPRFAAASASSGAARGVCAARPQQQQQQQPLAARRPALVAQRPASRAVAARAKDVSEMTC